jgi:prepilin-type N-terminal cleavage/methylation domain-containing protein
MRPDPAEYGFTLIEVLVALVVSTILIAIVADGAASARRREKAAVQKREVLLLARGLIAEAAAAPYSVEPQSGEINGLRYDVVQRVGAAHRRGLFALIIIDAAIRDKDGRALFSGETRRVKAVGPS